MLAIKASLRLREQHLQYTNKFYQKFHLHYFITRAHKKEIQEYVIIHNMKHRREVNTYLFSQTNSKKLYFVYGINVFILYYQVKSFFSALTANKSELTSQSALKSFCSIRRSSLCSLVTMVAWRGVLSRMDSPKAVPTPRVHIVTASFDSKKRKDTLNISGCFESPCVILSNSTALRFFSNLLKKKINLSVNNKKSICW